MEPIAEIIQTLTSIHWWQYKTLVELCVEQELCFQILIQAQAEDRQVLQSLVQLMGTPAAAPGAEVGLHHLTLVKIS